MDKEIILTITMLVSNREDTIEKCMESLQELRKAVPSELIVVDTAGNQVCMEIVGRYADKIVPFEWCDDFSAARNAGLKEARGKWVMFLDDDEWFESTGELQEFFVKGIFKKYKTAAYLTRNYRNLQGTVWSDRIAVRLSELSEGVAFRGKIHEYLAPVQKPTYYTKDYVHHYGYVFASRQQEIEHSWRNIRPLLQRRAEEPEDFHAAGQLLQEYRGAGEIFGAIELAKEMRNHPRWNEPSKLGFSAYAIVTEMELYRQQERYLDAYELGVQFVGEAKLLLVARGCIANLLVGVCLMLKKYQEAYQYIHNFYVLQKKWIQHKEEHYTDFFNMAAQYLSESEVKRLQMVELDVLVCMEQWEKAASYLESLNWNEERKAFLTDTPEDIIRVMIHDEEMKPAYAQAVSQLLTNEALEVGLYKQIEKLVGIEREKILRCFAQIETSHLPAMQLQLEYYIIRKDIQGIMSVIDAMEEKGYSCLLLEENIWLGLAALDISLERSRKAMRLVDFFEGIPELFAKVSYECCKAIARLLFGEEAEREDISMWYLQGLLLEKRFLSDGNSMSREDMWRQLENIAELWMGCARVLYQPNVLDGELISVLPRRFQFARLTLRAGEARKDERQHARWVAEAAKVYEPLREICVSYLKMSGQAVCADNADTNRVSDEFAALAAEVKAQIKILLQQERYSDALGIVEEVLKMIPEDEELLAIRRSLKSPELGGAWDDICSGLQENPENPEYYLMLGNYYLSKNLQQAYLCYENAWFYAEDGDKEDIEKLLEKLSVEDRVQVPKVAIVILSYNLQEDTRQCIESIRATVPERAREIVVVDNASTDGSVAWLREQKDVILIENKENMGFPKGCNQGIAAASEDADIFLLNNDTILPQNALFWLRMGLYEAKENGAAGSVSNYVSNLQQVAQDKKSVQELLEFARQNNVPMQYPYEEKLFLIGFALLIKRSAMCRVGVLDERFTPGNSEDVDYGLRMLKAGYRNILCRNSFILHFGSRSFGKLGNDFSQILNRNQQKLNEKWGMELQYYMFPRTELVGLIQEEREKPLKVLDIGCGCGAIMGRIKGEYPHAKVYGIELVPDAARLAERMGTVLCGDVEKMELSYEENFFDYCILGDVLEHLHNPGKLLVRLQRYMKNGGQIIVSMPNMKHWSVMIPLLRYDSFSYSDAGILDNTHLKMYTGHEIQKLIASAGYEIEQVRYTVAGEPKGEDAKLITELEKQGKKYNETAYMAYQYVVLAKVKK